jgi:hypothetical protein
MYQLQCLTCIYYRVRRYPQITTLSDNEAFCNFLHGLLDEQYVFARLPPILRG